MHPAMQILEERIQSLKAHLQTENPVLLEVVDSFRELDQVAYRMGLLEPHESFATQIPWWPLIAVLGVFSAGKSTFINHYLGVKLQRSGNQAVDDRFTVICYSAKQGLNTLPGVALDADPRFPFYQISKKIDRVAKGEGERIDAYLQLKTCPSEQLRNKIVIDSPGFDADAQRTSTLKITQHIVDLSDLVLVFFDARHPEPGAMQDTLKHLVSETIHRPDSGKFLYILNQIDTTAREDNPEEVIAAWQRALGERGLTAGRFYTIYNPDAAVPIEDEERRRRFESKRDEDLNAIHQRIDQVEIERAYRIVSVLEKTARNLADQFVPALSDELANWRRWVLRFDLAALILLILALVLTLDLSAIWHQFTAADQFQQTILLAITLLALLFGHFSIRRLTAQWFTRRLTRRLQQADSGLHGNLAKAFWRNTRPWRLLFGVSPLGWNRRNRQKVRQVIQDTARHIQRLNDRFTDPSGEKKIDS